MDPNIPRSISKMDHAERLEMYFRCVITHFLECGKLKSLMTFGDGPRSAGPRGHVLPGSCGGGGQMLPYLAGQVLSYLAGQVTHGRDDHHNTVAQGVIEKPSRL